MRRLLAILSLAAGLLAVAPPAGAATCAAAPRFAGSFLQPALGDTWSAWSGRPCPPPTGPA
ncbi:hypothetical protein [Nonomuraea zeae]|uniref:Uncharacterized protein n=1 Tax=Nonomuraea zeae TaxID=1642303 RepID=A0A5S4G175_9ACTN|nr:hypothetical protein [Nonomuraea zeae]TMR26716.1 hypothetical protein ETD85_41580 [Nonomuraea zeae]